MKISKECIEGCRRGEQTSQRELYDFLLPYLNALCGRYLRETSYRKDVLQEAFILIFNKIDQYDAEKGEIQSWAGRLVINLCLKQNKSGSFVNYGQSDSEKVQPQVNPDVIDQLSNEDLIRFLKTMPSKYYEVFSLFIIDGFSHEEIGKALGIRTSLSRKRLARARTWLQAKPQSLNALLGDYRFSIS